jgi:hypothetical protein
MGWACSTRENQDILVGKQKDVTLKIAMSVGGKIMLRKIYCGNIHILSSYGCALNDTACALNWLLQRAEQS